MEIEEMFSALKEMERELKRLRAERLEVLTFLRTVGEDDHRSGALIAARVLVRMNEPRNLT